MIHFSVGCFQEAIVPFFTLVKMIKGNVGRSGMGPELDKVLCGRLALPDYCSKLDFMNS